MKYNPQDIAAWNLSQLIENLRKQGIADAEIRQAMLAEMEGLK